ncbi:MAG: TonB-dependent receptor [Gemmatimonadetes bacterium]|nr:TonB-dependent receptor [Gemmatimonadota bacterium]
MRSPIRALLATFVALGAVAGSLRAQDARDTVRLEELVVTADRSPTPAGRVVAATTVLTGEQLREAGIYFVDQALARVPGAAVVPTGSYGGVSSVFLRGGESDYTKVLIDGVPVNQGGGSFNFGTLSTDNVERIEIVRGPASVLYGSDAVTGVINVITRHGRGGFRAEAASQAGSHGTWRGDVSASGSTPEVSYSAGLSRYRTDGLYRFNSGFASTVGSAALSVRPDARTDVTLTARTGDSRLGYATDFTGAVTDSNQSGRQDATTLGLELGRRFTDAVEVRVLLASHGQTDRAEDLPDSPGDSLGFYYQSQARSLRRSVDARGNVQLAGGVRLTAGAQAEFERLEEFSTTGAPFEASRRNVGSYAQAVVDLTARLLLNAGFRVDDNQKFGTHATYRLGAIYGVAGRTRLRGAIGSAFKEPSLRENFARSAFEVGNARLEPEQSRSWEVGVEQGLAGGALTLAVNYFDQRFRNLIQYDGGAAPGAPTYANVARATARGVELTGDFRPTPDLALTASYTHLATRVDDPGFSSGAGDAFVDGKALIRRPRHSARLDGHARVTDRVGLGLGVTYLGERADVDFRPFPSVRTRLRGVVTLDADATIDLLREAAGRPGITATLRGENLTDARYSTVVGFRARGRAVFAGLRVGL